MRSSGFLLTMILLSLFSVGASALYLYLAAGMQEEWMAHRLQQLAVKGIIDPAGANAAFEADGKPYRVDTPESGSLRGYVGMAREYVLDGTPQGSMMKIAIAMMLLNLLIAVIGWVPFRRISKHEAAGLV